MELAKSDPRAESRRSKLLRRPLVEFYDLDRDPFELENLASDPAHENDRKTLDATLLEWMRAHGDEGLQGSWSPSG